MLGNLWVMLCRRALLSCFSSWGTSSGFCRQDMSDFEHLKAQLRLGRCLMHLRGSWLCHLLRPSDTGQQRLTQLLTLMSFPSTRQALMRSCLRFCCKAVARTSAVCRSEAVKLTSPKMTLKVSAKCFTRASSLQQSQARIDGALECALAAALTGAVMMLVHPGPFPNLALLSAGFQCWVLEFCLPAQLVDAYLTHTSRMGAL